MQGRGKQRAGIGPFVCDPKNLPSSSNGKMGDGGGKAGRGGEGEGEKEGGRRAGGKGASPSHLYPAQWSSVVLLNGGRRGEGKLEERRGRARDREGKCITPSPM